MLKETTLQQTVQQLGDLLSLRGETVVTAESCTGGWMAKALTDRAGSSAYVLGGLVTYSNSMKCDLLDVPSEILAEHGAVSEPVVRQMVAGAVQATGANYAIATSGVAGPGGGTEDKPVGTVWFAWGAPASGIVAQQCHFDGDRDAVRRQSVVYALQGLLDYLHKA
ncbi:nicotinamide-nucleotide amidohydrolase family protein [Marinobacter bryozoorum]|uniref:CinA family protein n=1 Tax=Marinobacter bryozoorum TaxID=256324 RepID=UPI00200568E8|nr:nicotinamide-nucleotide amidohydrolase family protein [Marinobacter bryozoorum]MCK7545114.1 nicotinamide-nucleotide amidohydrolase family protein [Marinobacter bryozoorum]